MTRQARKKSKSGFYHIMIRGINKQIIFEDDIDKNTFLKYVKDSVKKYKVKLIAYCLMDNHVHFLIKDCDNSLANFMRSINSRYAGYFNQKYKRVGYLFQDRFKSETIEDNRRLLAAYRYILNNPYKAGICYARDYRWNSYNCYCQRSDFVDVEAIRDMIGDEEFHSKFMETYVEENFIDVMPSKFDDLEAKNVMEKVLGADSGMHLINYSKDLRNDGLRRLKNNGLSVKQINRLTGISISIIKRA